MNKLIALVVCLMVCALFGQSFGQENDFREQENTKRDLALNPETVKLCLNAVDFASFQTISRSFRGPTSISSADFNNDGLQDIVVAFSTDSKVVYYENNGEDSWSANVLGTVPGATSVFAADINGDGRVDVAATSTSTVYWFKNTGGGSWTQYTVGTSASPQSVFVADINGDTKLDIIAAGGEIRWFQNNIDNVAPNAWTSTPVAAYNNTVNSVFATDINKDGFIDLVVASSANDEVAWLPNNGGGGSDFSLNVIATVTDPVQVFCTDMDNDGYVDVMTVNENGNSTTLFFNSLVVNHTVPENNNNTVAASAGWVGIFVDEEQDAPQSLFATDINGDGFQDIVVAITGSNLVKWYNATTNNYTWVGHTVGNITAPTFVFAREIGDNSAKDVIVASESTNAVGWLEELCITTLPNDSSSSHVVGWATATGVIGGLLVLWILIAIVVGILDVIRHQRKKEAEKRKKEARAMLPPDLHHEDL